MVTHAVMAKPSPLKCPWRSKKLKEGEGPPSSTFQANNTSSAACKASSVAASWALASLASPPCLPAALRWALVLLCLSSAAFSSSVRGRGCGSGVRGRGELLLQFKHPCCRCAYSHLLRRHALAWPVSGVRGLHGASSSARFTHSLRPL